MTSLVDGDRKLLGVLKLASRSGKAAGGAFSAREFMAV